ncbi:MAG: hypothetical protein H7A25_04395 [Leptospiraceae bacterium]|nr:hypothetical protein [Leptospiraceae bacterium]MCP5499117.1 hypothetical protein [Leptospiraceae bacterium]
MKLFLSLFLPFTLLFANVFIYFYTSQKIQAYTKNPPFLTYDLSHSNRINRLSSVNHLLDRNPTSLWIKERDRGEKDEFDLILELRLSHFYKQGRFLPKQYKHLIIESCEEVSPDTQIDIELFTHEAINVDRVLRLPLEKVLKTFSEKLKPKIELDVSEVLQFSESTNYPDNIYIIGVKVRVPAIAGKLKPCLSEIYLEE